MLHCPTRKTHQSSPPADGNSRLPWNGSSTAQWNEKMLGVQESKGLTMPQTYHFDSRCIVWFHHCVRHLWRRDHGEGFHNASVVRSSEKMSARHVWKLNLVKGTEKNWENIYKTYCEWDAVWIFLTHFGDQQCAHSSASAATERMAKLEALQTSLVELLNQKERPLSEHLQYFTVHTSEYWRRNKAWNNCLAKWQSQLYYSRQASVASLCFFSDNIKYRVNQLSTFGVVTLTGFSTTNSWKIIQNSNHEHNLAFAQLLPAPARQFKQQNPIIWQFNIITWDIWKDYANLGMNRMAKPIAWSALQRHFQSKHFAERHPVTSLSAQRQSYLGETIGQMDQHEHCPWCLQGNQTKLASSKHGLSSLLRGITFLEPVFGKINICCSCCKRVTYIESNISQTHLLARGPLELHVERSVRPLLRWNKR